MMLVDYICTCKGTKCDHNGKSRSYDECEVVVTIPLTNGKVENALGKYEGYGYVLVKISGKNYRFYSRQFQDKFKEEYKERIEEGITDPAFIADEISTYSERIDASIYDKRIYGNAKVPIKTGCRTSYNVFLTKSDLKSFIPFDEKTVFQSRKELLEFKINDLEEQISKHQESIKSMKDELKRLV